MTKGAYAKRIKELEIYTRRLLNSSMVGDSRSAQKGTGFEFDQIREYQVGDDVRFIDWKATARNNKLLIKQCFEERSRIIWLVLDVSASGRTGTIERQLVLKDIAAILSLVGHYGKDNVGLILFSDEIEKVIMPSCSRNHLSLLMQTIFEHSIRSKKTNISAALAHLSKVGRANSLCLIISDFIDEIDTALLKVTGKKFDAIAVRVLDSIEQEFPDVGTLFVTDPETDERIEINSYAGVLQQFCQNRITQQNALFSRSNIETLDVLLNTKYIPQMISFFRRRMRY